MTFGEAWHRHRGHQNCIGALHVGLSCVPKGSESMAGKHKPKHACSTLYMIIPEMWFTVLEKNIY